MGEVVPSLVGRSRGTVRALRLLNIAAVIVPALLFAAAAWQNRGQVLRGAEESIGTTAALLHEHALKVFETHELLFEQIDQAIRKKDWATIERSKDLAELLRRLDHDFDQVGGIWLIDATGRVRQSSRETRSPVPLDLADRSYFAAQVQPEAGTYISDEAAPDGTREARRTFALSRRRSTADGHFEGVIVLAAYPDYFEEFYRSIGAPNNYVVSLVRADGAVLARSPRPKDNASTVLRDDDIRALAGRAMTGSFWTKSSADGARRFVAFQRLKTYPLYVTVAAAENGILREWYGNVLLYGAVAFPASLALLWVAWIALERARQEEAAMALLEEEMKRREAAETALLQSQKMEAVGQLTGGIAHDFNNLLTVVSGNLELLERTTLDDRQQRMVGAAVRAARRGEGLAQQLLAFSRRQVLRPVDFHIDHRLAEMAELLDRSLRADIRVAIEVPPGTWRVHADPAQFDLAVLNVAVNARDAMPNGGRLTIEARNLVLPREDASVPLAGEFVAIRIADTGLGMERKVQARAFEPFFTTKEVGKGSGLGLSQVYGFATQSGGTVVLASEPGQGTRVTIYLPRAAASGDAAPGEGDARHGRRVLLVEDDREVADLAAMILQDLSCSVLYAESAQQALDLLVRGERVDLVFSDIVMPGMSGLDLAREIRRRWPELPVLLTSGYSGSAGEARGEGFQILAKPYSATALRVAIDRHTRVARPA